MKVVIQLSSREEAKALPILLRHSPGMVLPNRTYVLREAAVSALREAGIDFTEVSREADAPNLTGDLEDEEWASWYRLTPQERWRETEKLWEFYLLVGGSLDAEPDSQSPFDLDRTPGPAPTDGRPGMRVIRRSGI